MRRGLILVIAASAAMATACLLSLDFGELTRDHGADVGEAGLDAALDTTLPETSDATDSETDAIEIPAHCSDKKVGDGETDIDCGGTCPRCGAGKKCDVPGDCNSGNCIGSKCVECPAGMVRVRIVTGAVPLVYCIDANEVSAADYALFSSTVTPTTTKNPLPTPCAVPAKTSFVAGYPGGTDAGPTTPVRYVDWCDAWAYCDWAGKRLCGQIGGKTNPYDRPNDPSSGQWRRACSADKGIGDASVWPYGASANADLCETRDRDGGVADAPPPGAPVESGFFAGCKGSSSELNASLFDQSGNIAEWEDSCSPSYVTCWARGGSFKNSSKEASCAASEAKAPLTRSEAIGFRCCKL